MVEPEVDENIKTTSMTAFDLFLFLTIGPGPLQNLKNDSLTASSVQLSWRHPMLYPGPVDYKIEVYEETSINSSKYTLKSTIIVHGMYFK